MLTDRDINRIVEASREVFVTRGEFQDFLVEFREWTSSVDTMLKSITRHDDEIAIINHRLAKFRDI